MGSSKGITEGAESRTDFFPFNLGLKDSPPELMLKLLLQHAALVRAGWLYEHLTTPIAVTFQKGSIPENHSCTNLYRAL
jgi:hypothetical protein